MAYLQFKDSEKSHLALPSQIQKYDVNRNGILESSEIEKLMKYYGKF